MSRGSLYEKSNEINGQQQHLLQQCEIVLQIVKEIVNRVIDLMGWPNGLWDLIYCAEEELRSELIGGQINHKISHKQSQQFNWNKKVLSH